MTKLVAGYGRVSTIEQALKGTSAEEQENKIRKACEYKNYGLYRIYTDKGISGKTLKTRPGIQSLISDAKAGKFEIIMFTKLDRLSRNLRDLLNFWDLMTENLDLEMYCISDPSLNSDTSLGKVMLQTLGVFSEFERNLIRERTGEGRKNKLKDGSIFPGSVPFGYKFNSNKKIVEKDSEQVKVYELIVDLYLNQHFSIKDVALKLTQMGVKTPSAGTKKWKSYSTKWNPFTVSKILKHPAYTGRAVVYNQFVHTDRISQEGTPYMAADTSKPKPKDEWIQKTFPPLISENRWEQIQTRIQQQKQKPKKRHKGLKKSFLAKNALGRAFVCFECGGAISKSHKYKEAPYYGCYWHITTNKERELQGKEKCNLKMVKADTIDNDIFNSIVEILSNPYHFGRQWLNEADITTLDSEINTLNKDIKKAQNELKNAAYEVTRAINHETKLIYRSIISECESNLCKLNGKLELKLSERNNQVNAKANLKELDSYIKKIGFQPMSEHFKPLKFDGKYKSKFKQYLLDLPHIEKQRVISAVISPEQGGKVYLKWPRAADVFGSAELSDLTQDEFGQPLKQYSPIVELVFSLDVQRLNSIIASFDKIKLLKEFHSYGTPRWIHDAFGWRRFFR
jgi:site-specific DNA recombinase